MTLNEAFEVLQNNPHLNLDRWGDDSIESPAVIAAVEVMLNNLRIKSTGDARRDTEILAHAIWLVTIAFEAGRIYEGGKPE